VEHEYELKLLHKNAELKLFQYQINPHFLYNTYFALCGLISEEEYDHASSLAELMGKYLRYVTVSDQISGRLEEELEHAQAYMEIQQMRFQKRMSSHMEACPPQCRHMQVPRLVVQPLIENAFEHGVKLKVHGGMIRVSFAQTETAFEIIVEDNGETITDEQIESLRRRFRSDEYRGDSVALINVDSRLAEFFGPESGLRLERSELGGLKSIIHIEGSREHVSHPDC